MKCPFCGAPENRVVDSRLSREQTVIRRRRACDSCHRRFTTYERVEELAPMVVKKDGRREHFDRQKLRAGIMRACEKRPISAPTIDSLVEGVERWLTERGEKEIPSREIGDRVMESLRDLDAVAYVRFASVYRSFRDVEEFMEEIRSMEHHLAGSREDD
ncbi:MAG: transcriptional regulator NrdR [Myxococcota bacterium]